MALRDASAGLQSLAALLTSDCLPGQRSVGDVAELIGVLIQLSTLGLLFADRIQADGPSQESLRPLVAEWSSQAALAADLAQAAALGDL
jgi:hypothetical protein